MKDNTKNIQYISQTIVHGKEYGWNFEATMGYNSADKYYQLMDEETGEILLYCNDFTNFLNLVTTYNKVVNLTKETIDEV